MRTRRRQKPLFVLTTFVLLFWAPQSIADRQLALARYRALVPELEASPLDLPVSVDSKAEHSVVRASVHSIVDRPFGTVSHALGDPEVWCDLLPLHFNVKACIHTAPAGAHELGLFIGRKFYQAIGREEDLRLEFEVTISEADFLQVQLAADAGPMWTNDYAMTLVAIPLDANRSLIHLRLSVRYGWVTRNAVRVYFNTLGRGKVGFSIEAREPGSEPRLVRSWQGMIERNVMRYHLAIQAYLETLHLTPEARFEGRLIRWFDLSDAYRRQLHEMEKLQYLDYKRREYVNQEKARAEAKAQVDR